MAKQAKNDPKKDMKKSDDVLMREMMKQEMMEKISNVVDKDQDEFMKVLKTMLSSDDYDFSK